MNARVSCSETGEGPGTGGRGDEGGRDKGGLEGCRGLGRGLAPGKPRGVPNGVEGMWDGGAGNEEMSSGTTSLRLLDTPSDDEVAMAVRGEVSRQNCAVYIPRCVSGGPTNELSGVVTCDCGRVAEAA